MVHVGDKRARVVFASPSRLDVIVPAGLTAGGLVPVEVAAAGGNAATIQIAAPCATGLHQVDSPVFDREGNLYVTYSGTRGQQVPVSIFRVRPNGTRETFSSGVVNPTSMAIDADGRDLHVEPLRGDRLPIEAGRIGGALRHGSGRRVRAGVFVGRYAVCRRSLGHDLQCGPQRARDDVRVAAAQRRRVSPCRRPRTRPVRHRPHALLVRRRLSD